MDVQVTLTPAELELAAIVGAKRQVENLFAHRVHANNAPADQAWQMHIEGAAGEMAVAKWRNYYWTGNLGNLKADDVGHAQVRTCSQHDYCLIIHATDHDDRPYILVSGLAPNYVLRGWIWGHEGKKDEYWRDPKGNRPAYFVPQSRLRPMPGKDTARPEAPPQ